jgi:hypothetical protein
MDNMLLETIYRYYENVASKGSTPLSKFEYYIMSLTNKKLQLIDRLEKNFITEIPGARLIKHILGLVEQNILNTYITDIDKLINYFLPNKDLFDGIYDTIRTNKTYHRLFCSPNNVFDPEEFILPISKANYIDELPLDKPWAYWQNEKAVRVINHDSNEYTLDIKNGLRFYIDPPFFIIIGIDSIVLTFMYHKYLEANKEEEFPLQTFIYKFVLIPLLNDLQDIWIRNQINQIIDIVKSGEYEKIDTLSDNVRNFSDYNYIGSNYKGVIKELTEPIKKLQQGNFNVKSVLESLHLSNPIVSLYDHMTTVYNECRLPELKQYEASMYLRDMLDVKLLLKLFLLNDSSSETKNLLIRIRRDLARFKRTKFWQNTKYDLIREIIREDLDQLEELIN